VSKPKRQKPRLVEQEDHSLLGKTEPLLGNERLIGDEPLLGNDQLFDPDSERLFSNEEPEETPLKKTKRESTFWDW